MADVHFKAVSTGGANISISRAELVSGQGQPVVLRPPASAVPLSVGVASLVMLSVDELPVSEPLARLKVGMVLWVSMVST